MNEFLFRLQATVAGLVLCVCAGLVIAPLLTSSWAASIGFGLGTFTGLTLVFCVIAPWLWRRSSGRRL